MTQPITPRRSRRLVLGIMAPEGHGKTHLALTLPRPLAVFSIDPNTDEVVERAFGVGDVSDLDPAQCQYHRVSYPIVGLGVSEALVQEEAKDSWYVVEDGIRAIYEGTLPVMPRSVVIDSGTLLDRLNKLREWGRTDKIAPRDRMIKLGALNKDFNGLFDMLERAGVHVAVTHRAAQRWEDIEVRSKAGVEVQSKPMPGVYDRIGYKEFGNLCSTEVLGMFDAERGGKVSNKFGLRVLRSRQRPAVIGEEYWGRAEDGTPVTSFPFLGTLLYQNTTVEDWR